MVFGTFDGIHEGHRNMFRQARAVGSESGNRGRSYVHLCVVVARDKTVRAVKGHNPKYSESIRYGCLAGEDSVNQVLLGNEDDKYAVILQKKPDIICLGYDQECFVKGLRGIFSGKIVRLREFYPDQYKSSKLLYKKDMLETSKEALRKHLFQKMENMNKSQRERESRMIRQSILSLIEVQKTKTIALYLPFAHEVDVQQLFDYFRKVGKTLLVPDANSYEGFHMQKVCSLNIPSSKGKNNVYTRKIPMCIVPCVGVDGKGNRLGRGGGWYDQFLENHPETLTIGVAFSVQKVEQVPIGKYDKKMSIVCTTKNSLPIIERYDILDKLSA